MDYPRLLNLDTSVEDALKSYLDTELLNHYAERGAWVDDLISWQRDYWAKPAVKQRTFPFTGAANVIIPLSAIAFEAIHARSMTTLFGLKQMITAKPRNPDYEDAAPKFESWLQYELEQNKFKHKIESSIIEIEKLGTGVGRTSWCKIVKTGVRIVAGEEQEFPVIIKQGSTVDSVPLSRFLMPFAANDPQLAAWCGEEMSMTEAEIDLHCKSGLLYEDAIDKLRSYYQNQGNFDSQGRKYEQAQELLENRQPVFPNRVILQYIWLGFDVAGNGNRREIVIHYHRDSRQVISCRYNWYADLRRPYRIGTYIPVEHRWTGVGIMKQNEQFQKEVTTQHRQRLDNATLANIKMYKISKLSGYGPKEPIFPGKMWFLDDMTHMEAIEGGSEIYPSSYNNEQQTVLYSQQRTGVNEVTLGMPQVGTPGTATGDLQRVQEGKRKFDYTFGNIREFCNQLLVDYVCECQQYGPKDIRYYDQADGGKLVQQILTLPESLVREGLILEFKLTGEQENQIVDRQNWTQVAGMLTQYYTSLIQLAQGLGDQQRMVEIITKAMSASSEAMKQIAESFNLKNVDRIVMTELISNAITKAAGGPQQLQSLIGGNSGVSQTSAIQPMVAPTQVSIRDPQNFAGAIGGIQQS